MDDAASRSWRGRRVWITGASSGIGLALAHALAARGARIAATARSADALAAGVASLPGTGHLSLPADVTDSRAMRDAVARIVDAWGGLDLAVLNAGTHAPMRADAIDLDAAHRLLDINVGGAFNTAAAAIPVFLTAGSGHIAVVASVAGYIGLPTALVYGPSKAALINFAEILRLDLAPRGVKVQLVCPGFVETPLTDRNDFPMPARLGVDDAAARIARGLDSDRFEIHFPRRFTLWLKLLRVLPYGVALPLIRRMTGM